MIAARPGWATAADVDAGACASAVVFVEETVEVSTTICIYNYFTAHYGFPAIVFAGYRGDTGERILEVDSAREELCLLRCSELLPAGFGGNLLLVAFPPAMQAGDVFPHRLLQLTSIFRFREGSVSTIHGQGQLTHGPNNRAYHCFDIESGFPDVALLLQNHSLSEECHSTGRLFDDAGAQVTLLASAPAIPPLGLLRMPLKPEIERAFAAAPYSRRLSLILEQSVDSRRPLYRLERNGRFAMNHGSYIYAGTRQLGAADDTFLGMICCGLPLERDAPYTISFAVDNHNGPVAQRSLDAIVFDSSGTPVSRVDRVLTLEPNGVNDVSPDLLRSRAGLPEDFVGHAFFAAHPDADGSVLAELQFNLSTRASGVKSGGCMIGGYIQNTAEAPGARGEGFRRNRTFSPVYLDESIDTVLYLFNNSSVTTYDYAPKLSLTFVTHEGVEMSDERTVRPNQMLRVSMREWLGTLTPDATSRTEPLIGWVVCKSVEAQLPGFYVIHDVAGHWADIDHLFGG